MMFKNIISLPCKISRAVKKLSHYVMQAPRGEEIL
jgi:hypothetical protein